MPQIYLNIRNACYAKKKKINNGGISDKEKQECKKMAAIAYYKRTGKPVQEADASFANDGLPDAVDLVILDEQVEFFGSLEAYEEWSNGEN